MLRAGVQRLPSAAQRQRIAATGSSQMCGGAETSKLPNSAGDRGFESISLRQRVVQTFGPSRAPSGPVAFAPAQPRGAKILGVVEKSRSAYLVPAID